jgi:hypothetical protein
MAVWPEAVVPVALGAVPEAEPALDGPAEPVDPPPPVERPALDEPLALCPLLEPDDVEAEGTDADGVDVEGTVPTGVLTDGVVTLGVLTGGVVTLGVVTFGVVTEGVVTVGVVTDGVVTVGVVTGGVVTAGVVTEGTVTCGTVADGTVTDGTCCAPAGIPLIPSEATTSVAPNHRRRRVMYSPSRLP